MEKYNTITLNLKAMTMEHCILSEFQRHNIEIYSEKQSPIKKR